mmetsp:Transcript_46213/g.122042  ORF Transcript_46213/g.122042 Transcript_46213/m.122042 type:complete len:148 (-) Transcript_46213:517-960(-)
MVQLAIDEAMVKNTFLSCEVPVRQPRRALSQEPKHHERTSRAEEVEDEQKLLRSVAFLQGDWCDRREKQIRYEVRGWTCTRVLLLDGSRVDFPMHGIGGVLIRGEHTKVSFDSDDQCNQEEVVWRVTAVHRRRGQTRAYCWTRATAK